MKVINDGRSAGSTSYMWVHRLGEYYKDRPVILYEYQKTRHHRHPEEFYKGFKGILVTDGLAQYHLLTGPTPDICMPHVVEKRRYFILWRMVWRLLTLPKSYGLNL